MKARVVGLGEVLWDLLPEGPQLGGAPANFACHAAALGAEAALISRLGSDALGVEARRRLQDRGLDLSALAVDPCLPTGTVVVEVGALGQPSFQIVEGIAWDALVVDDAALTLMSGADAVCFGSLAQRTPGARKTIQQLVSATRPEALRVFDINLRAPFHTPAVIEESLQLANVLKLNEAELPVLARLFDLRGSVDSQLETLASHFGLQVVALTLGAAGSRLFRAGRWTAEPGREVVVRDAVGAGDSFTAVLVLGLLRNWESRQLLTVATEVAAFVCTQAGATPELPDTITQLFRDGG